MNTQESTVEAEHLSEVEGHEVTFTSHEVLLTLSQNEERYLGMAYHKIYLETHQLPDLEKAILFYKIALHTCGDDTKHQLNVLNKLGTALYTIYEELGVLSCLEEAIMCYRQAVELSTPDDPESCASVNNLGNALSSSYGLFGDLEDLEDAIANYKHALELPGGPGHMDKSVIMNNLANTLQTRYQQLGDLEDLKGAITYYQEGLDLCPPDDPNKAVTLSNFAGALSIRFQKLGEIKDLETAIIYSKEALTLYPPGHSGRPACLTSLSIALQIRFKQLGKMGDLEMAVTCNEQALDLCSSDHPFRPTPLSNLANSLQARYDQLGEMKDLERAIILNEQALDLCPPSHLNRPAILNNLATVLQIRYRQIREIGDLEKAITHHEEALDLCPHGHSLRLPTLGNLANALQEVYNQVGVIGKLEEAITYYEQGLDLCLSGSPGRPMSLNNLGDALWTRYKKYRKMEDLEKAITYNEQALDLRPPGHSDRYMSLNSIANVLQSRYEDCGDIKDLEKAITWNEQGLDLCPPGHPGRSRCLENLGYRFYGMYEKLGSQEYLVKAINCHKQAASTAAILPHRLIAAKTWAMTAHKHGVSSAISAYSLALDLLQQHLALLPSITSQQRLVEKSSNLILDAASCAIGTSTPEMAVQLLEQGRSILWSKIQDYRQSLGDISHKAPELAKEFQNISKQLEHNSTSNDANITLQNALSEKWTALVGEIRKLDGFSDYLQATSFEILQNASAEGPVIMVNISHFGSDAIILVSHGPPVVVPLPDVSPQMLYKLVKDLSSATTRSDSPQTVPTVLQKLWNTVVGPVVEQLAELGVPEKSRIWWCPTSYLCALPLHAAGPYRRGSKNLPDLYISSYTPTLASLIRARSNMPKVQSVPTLLIVSQPDDTIPQVFEETTAIKGFGVQVNSYSEHEADRQGVVVALQSHSWVHFACHGHLEDQPFNSWFQLHNGEHLTVLDLAKAELPNAEFAFLSACHSAAGDIHGAPDESIHLAGALQFSGFRSVVGTLWAMVDDDGPPMANAFYKHIFRNPGNVDLRDAAVALNVATKELRRNKVPVDRWINFIHIGA